MAGLAAGDDGEQFGRAWIAAQELRLLYREHSRDPAERRLLRWFTEIAEHDIPELIRLARTLMPGGMSCSPTSTLASPTAPPKPRPAGGARPIPTKSKSSAES